MIKKLSDAFEKYNLIFLLALIAWYLRSRYLYLGEISYYMNTDEMHSAYNAMCMAKGSGIVYAHPSLISLAASIIFRLKGGLFSLKLFRLLAVAGGLFGMVFSYLSVLEMTGQRKYAFLEAVLVTTLPVFFIPQRTGVEYYLFMYIVPAAFFFLIKTVRLRRILPGVISAVLWALIIYTMWPMTQGMSISNIPSNLVNITALLWDDHHPFNISSAFGTVYVFSIPVAFIGIVVSVRKAFMSIREKKPDPYVLLWIFIILTLLPAFACKGADTKTVNGLFFAVSIIICEGLIYLCENIRLALPVEIAVYLICFGMFTHYYFENFNSEVNNSADHAAGIIVDKSVGEAIKASANLFPGMNITVIDDNFEGRNLMIALFGGAYASDYSGFQDLDDFSFTGSTGNIRVGGDTADMPDDTVYVIEEAGYGNIINDLTQKGWGMVYMKEYIICYRQ